MGNKKTIEKTAEDIRIRKVKMLGDRARETAKQMGLKKDDLVIVRTHIKSGSIPICKLPCPKEQGFP